MCSLVCTLVVQSEPHVLNIHVLVKYIKFHWVPHLLHVVPVCTVHPAVPIIDLRVVHLSQCS